MAARARAGALILAGLLAVTHSAWSHDADAGAPPGPTPGTRFSAEYVRSVGRLAYFWAWPMVNVHSRVAASAKLAAPALMGGIAPVAPSNQLAMLTDYIAPEERVVACPNSDVVYGFASVTLDREPVVVQVPDFGERFWVYQVVDQRTDSFADLGKQYGTKPGFYLLVGPDWKGETPSGIERVFRSPTNIGIVIPRAFMDDTSEDRAAVQLPVSQIGLYPLSAFDGKVKTTDWKALPKLPSSSQGQEEAKWVVPEQFADVLPAVLDEVPPEVGEGALYANFRAVLDAAHGDPKLRSALLQGAASAEKELVDPLFEFRNFGVPLSRNWTTQKNGAQFGSDYFTRTAVAKSNIFVNRPSETTYTYLDQDGAGARLNGTHSYTITYPAGQVPPVKGFWSLTLYNKHHFFEPNSLGRYSVGTKNKNLHYGVDGSLTLYISAKPPADKSLLPNWLPAPKDDFSLYGRAYWPDEAILNGTWTPPAVAKVE
jgi:hypothetical protein